MEPSEKDLVLIHCYGKVGSITIEKALSKFLHKISDFVPTLWCHMRPMVQV